MRRFIRSNWRRPVRLILLVVAGFLLYKSAYAQSLDRSTWYTCDYHPGAYTGWGHSDDGDITSDRCTVLTWSASADPHGFRSSLFNLAARGEVGVDSGSNYLRLVVPPSNVRTYSLQCVSAIYCSHSSNCTATVKSESGTGSTYVGSSWTDADIGPGTGIFTNTHTLRWTATTGDAWSYSPLTSSALVGGVESTIVVATTGRIATTTSDCYITDWDYMTSGFSSVWVAPDAPTSTPTNTPVPTSTPTPTNTPTNTPTSTPTNTPTNTPTSTPTSTDTSTPTFANTPTNTPTAIMGTVQRQPALRVALPTTSRNPRSVQATPTFAIPPGGTPVPGSTPFAGVAWLCWGDSLSSEEGDLGHANVCTWGDYFEFTLDVVSTKHGDDFVIYAPPGSGSNRILAVAVPDGIDRMRMTCSALGITEWDDSGNIGGVVSQYMGSSCTGDCSVDMEVVEGDFNRTFAGPGTFLDTVIMTFTADVGHVLPGGIPLRPQDLVDYPHVYGRVMAQTQRLCIDNDGHPECWLDENASSLRMACEINAFWKGSQVYLPPTPKVGDGAPLATRIPGAGLATPVAWVPAPNWGIVQPWVSTPSPVDLEVEPIDSVCTVVIPAFSFGPFTLFGYVLESAWDSVEVCTDTYAVSLQWLGIDFGLWLIALTVIGAVGILYSRLK